MLMLETARDWRLELLVCPHCQGRLASGERKHQLSGGWLDTPLECPRCGPVGSIDAGIIRLGSCADDEATSWYRAKGGSDFKGRMQIPFTMSALDAPVYHRFLEQLRPSNLHSVILDVGAADGRNTEPWLDWGFQRVVASDVSFASLARLRQRLAALRPETLDRLLLIECDARCLPLAAKTVDVVVATEVLCCLNEGYGDGLAECVRVLKDDAHARLLISERSYEGGLITRLLYDGVCGLARMHGSRYLLDGAASAPLRTRTFTEDELVGILRQANLAILECKGTSILSLLLGYLRGNDNIAPQDQQFLPQVQALLQELGEAGKARRTHTIVARKNATGPR